jgi:O-acetyl-ADP-ribose deacetylase (regulator of RNase III)
MIQYVHGDLLDAPHPVIAHGCNTQGIMRAGVALAVRQRWPLVFQQYKSLCDNAKGHGRVLGGSIQALTNTDDHRFIVNMFTQLGTGGDRAANYEYIYQSFETLERFCVDQDIESIAIPRIGCGIGGAVWSIVEPMIEKTMNRSVFVYDLEPWLGTEYTNG